MKIYLFQMKSDTGATKGRLNIYQKVEEMTDNAYTNIRQLEISFETRGGVHTTVILDSELGLDYAMINGKQIELVSQWPTTYTPDLPVVKRASSLFVIVSGFGFRIYWSPNNAVYIQLEPWYHEMVNKNDYSGQVL